MIRTKNSMHFVLFFLMVSVAYSFIELYETEHAQQQLADEFSDIEGITKAKNLIDKMKDGVGGSTIAIHHPSGRRFIHRNKWIMICNGEISKENGHCNGNALESVTAFKPQTNSEYCYIKNYHSINETLCLSPHPVNLTFENNTIVCEAVTEYFPALAITIDDYLKMCEKISSNVTYIYFANDHDPEHVEIPNENPHVKCDNEMDNDDLNKTLTPKKRKFMQEFSFSINKTGICVFTEQDMLVLKLLQYLKL
ncbi:uncharacterized protein LOC126737901 [Anthonomus grandis grandis]|uniref:uncharacterized protein LOC126737901 n=1 Tax=Anthonomus grandis grandis TaxID=2921223 RepID=UPI002165B912|nr:uncharacterized protein LOC126737901 [Anthonomus grandis grandis]